MHNEVLLQMQGIDKAFTGVRALSQVDFTVRRGEVHALMGENGAGKSTLIKVLTGIYHKDAGSIQFDGKEIHAKTALEAQSLGISTIYQELNLVPFQAVYENIYMGREPRTKLGTIDRRKMIRDARGVLEGMGIGIDVTAPLRNYSTAVQQMVAIARALTINAKLVVMDEPTSSLDSKEVEVLFSVIRRLKAQGIAIIFISHRLGEIFEICERVTVLRNGELAGVFDIESLNMQILVDCMLGRAFTSLRRSKGAYGFAGAEEVVRLQDVSWSVRLNGIGVDVKKGEILGLAGLLGSGRSELCNILFGAMPPDDGNILWLEKPSDIHTPRDAIRLGMGYCTEDRKVEGLFMHLSVKDNLTMALLPQLTKNGIVQRKKQDAIVQQFIERLAIKTPSSEQLVRYLSGGNQQKVLLARWMCMNPKLIILDEPTRGIDVGAKAEIEALIQEFSNAGISVLMISSEMEELVRNCDRIVVMRDGKKLGELIEDRITMDAIMDTISQSHSDILSSRKEVPA